MSACRSGSVWERLPVERRWGALLVFGQVALRQIRRASVADETADDAGRAIAASGRQLALRQDRRVAPGTSGDRLYLASRACSRLSAIRSDPVAIRAGRLDGSVRLGVRDGCDD